MPDSKKAVTKNRCGITGIRPAASMGPIKAVATTNRRRRISILTPSLIRTNLPSIPDGTEGINGIPFQPSSTQAPPATAPPSAAFKGIKIVAPAAAKPSTTLAIRAHRGRGCCHRMSFTRPLYLKDSPSLGDVFAYQLSPEAATTQTKHLILLHAGRSSWSPKLFRGTAAAGMRPDNTFGCLQRQSWLARMQLRGEVVFGTTLDI